MMLKCIAHSSARWSCFVPDKRELVLELVRFVRKRLVRLLELLLVVLERSHELAALALVCARESSLVKQALLLQLATALRQNQHNQRTNVSIFHKSATCKPQRTSSAKSCTRQRASRASGARLLPVLRSSVVGSGNVHRSKSSGSGTRQIFHPACSELGGARICTQTHKKHEWISSSRACSE